MWLKAPLGPEHVAGSLMRTFTNAPPFGVDDFPLLLQPERTSAQTSEITASVQHSALLCMAEPRSTGSGKTLTGTRRGRGPDWMEHSSCRSQGKLLKVLQHKEFVV